MNPARTRINAEEKMLSRSNGRNDSELDIRLNSVQSPQCEEHSGEILTKRRLLIEEG